MSLMVNKNYLSLGTRGSIPAGPLPPGAEEQVRTEGEWERQGKTGEIRLTEIQPLSATPSLSLSPEDYWPPEVWQAGGWFLVDNSIFLHIVVLITNLTQNTDNSPRRHEAGVCPVLRLTRPSRQPVVCVWGCLEDCLLSVLENCCPNCVLVVPGWAVSHLPGMYLLHSLPSTGRSVGSRPPEGRHHHSAIYSMNTTTQPTQSTQTTS